MLNTCGFKYKTHFGSYPFVYPINICFVMPLAYICFNNNFRLKFDSPLSFIGRPWTLDGVRSRITFTFDLAHISAGSSGSFMFRTRAKSGTMLYMVSRSYYLGMCMSNMRSEFCWFIFNLFQSDFSPCTSRQTAMLSTRTDVKFCYRD